MLSAGRIIVLRRAAQDYVAWGDQRRLSAKAHNPLRQLLIFKKLRLIFHIWGGASLEVPGPGRPTILHAGVAHERGRYSAG